MTIKEVEEQVGIKKTNIRYYEEAGLITPDRDRENNYRSYSMEDVELLEEIAETVSKTALCGLGKTAANPVLSTLKYFRDEYMAHVIDKRCPAGVCSALRTFKIDETKCKGCSLCSKKCPVGAISGELKSPFKIDASNCIKCGACQASCNFGAVICE